MTIVDLKYNLTIEDELRVCILVFPASCSHHTHTHTHISISRFVFHLLCSQIWVFIWGTRTVSKCVCVCYQFLSVRWLILKSHFPPDIRLFWVCWFALMLVEIEVTCFCHKTITIQFSWIIAL